MSATLNQKIEALGSKLMESYVTVGFDSTHEENPIAAIPKQIKQYYAEVPTQFRLLYLLAFLFT